MGAAQEIGELDFPLSSAFVLAFLEDHSSTRNNIINVSHKLYLSI